MPVDPVKWPGQILATSFSDILSNSEDSILRPIENVKAIAYYLRLAQSNVHYNECFGQLIDDFVIVNTLTEYGRVVRQ